MTLGVYVRSAVHFLFEGFRRLEYMRTRVSRSQQIKIIPTKANKSQILPRYSPETGTPTTHRRDSLAGT